MVYCITWFWSCSWQASPLLRQCLHISTRETGWTGWELGLWGLQGISHLWSSLPGSVLRHIALYQTVIYQARCTNRQCLTRRLFTRHSVLDTQRALPVIYQPRCTETQSALPVIYQVQCTKTQSALPEIFTRPCVVRHRVLTRVIYQAWCTKTQSALPDGYLPGMVY